MAERVRPYLFYDVAMTICSRCYRKLEGKIVFQDDKVFLLKRCPVHGAERVLIADDVDYYRRCRELFIKKPEMPLVYNTPVKWGVPTIAACARTTSSIPACRWLKSRTAAICVARCVMRIAARKGPSIARWH